MGAPSASPASPPPSPWHDWWKLPVFFAGLAVVLAVLAFLGPGGLLLLLFVYLVARAAVMVVALLRKPRKPGADK